MIHLPLVPELNLIALYEAGVPNRERVLFKAVQRANLAQFAIGVCWQNSNGLVTPMQDYFWLGDQIVEPPTMVFVYTGQGTQQIGQFPDGQPYLSIHMGRDVTVFNRLEIVPVLFRVDSMTIGRHYDAASGELKSIAVSPVVKPPAQLPGPSKGTKSAL